MSSRFSPAPPLGDGFPDPTFTVVSTFAGTGGSSLGYRYAGGKVRLAVEWNAHAASCYRLNFPDTPMFEGDIADLSAERALEIAGLEPGELDVFDGSPPCQGFSTSGRRAVDDPRNGLFKEYVRLLEAFKPRAFVMENVSGMVKGKMKVLFAEILRTLRGCGYGVSARLLNAAHLGVPQNRQRLIFVGVRKDLGVAPSHPKPRTRPIAAREALAGVEPPGPDHPELAPRYLDAWMRIVPGNSMKQLTPNGSHFSDVVKLHPERPAPTLMSTTTLKGYASLCHWREPRALTIPEAKRLHSFPDDFVLTGSHEERWARIGNSVPPLMMKAVAEHVRDHVLGLADLARDASLLDGNGD